MMSRAIYQGKTCRFVLGEDSLRLEEDAECAETQFSVSYEDVIGLRVPKQANAGNNACTTELYIYKKENPPAVVCSRRLSSEVIVFPEFEDFDTNHRAAMAWREAIQLQRTKNSKRVFMCTPEQMNSLEPLRLLVIINPFSGKKNSEKLYRTIARPMFEVAGAVIVQELITERIGHAKEFMETFDLSTITGIVLASGDGIIYEVINGLMARPDWETAIETPLGILPTGSGNALVSSLLYEANEELCVIENAAFQIINGGVKAHDIASVSTKSSHSYACALIHWGLTGTVDVESERLRFLGGQLRNLIGGLIGIAMKRSYHGQLSYLPIEDDDDGKGESSSSVEATAPSDKGDTSEEAVRPSTCINVTDPIPEKWKTIEGNFVVFMPMMVSHIADKDIMCAEANTGSGNFTIIYTFDDVTRGQLISKMVDNTGTAKIENFHEVRTRAFRLNPISSGIISVDGERVEYGPLQVQVHPGMMRLFSRVKL